MKNDPIVKDVRSVRREIYESYDGDLQKMFDDVMQRQWKSCHDVVNLAKESKDRPGVSHRTQVEESNA